MSTPNPSSKKEEQEENENENEEEEVEEEKKRGSSTISSSSSSERPQRYVIDRCNGTSSHHRLPAEGRPPCFPCWVPVCLKW